MVLLTPLRSRKARPRKGARERADAACVPGTGNARPADDLRTWLRGPRYPQPGPQDEDKAAKASEGQPDLIFVRTRGHIPAIRVGHGSAIVIL